ncbi:asparagine synthase (glutamine-hydrolyzing) [Aliarcobacter butzleri]|uniref:asparagine synthase (glutamine-hydrolyzing) n=1 Tax=Aliarcobacter butzleri TaxID=28197 RepID=UPI002B24C376|nr:asparagine synthase (glutamine-hydrolyzing) [Aliarcobacter butzleri]
MCGISGIIYKNKNKKDYQLEVKKMNDLINHRGPDDKGLFIMDNFAFGHTRLSILDLSSAGHQPMVYDDRFVITYNGEVYNYLEIKDELIKLGYKFKSNSDTEVLLLGYVEWKEKIVDRLNGMFAFAIYDMKENICFIARDRIGVKPLYYYETDEELYFFSEPKQIIMSNILDAIPNENSIKEYLAYQFTLSDETFFKGINKLLPGHFIKYEKYIKTISQYWSLDSIEIDKKITYDQAKENIQYLINDAIKLRLRSDVKVGCYLSGGIDSSIVSTISSKNLEKLDTYTFTSKNFPNQDESKIARKTSKYIESNHHEIEIEFDKILNLWKESVYYMDEPEVGYSLLPQMKISKEVSKNIKVILGGQGGDELFYGYGWHTQVSTSLRHKLEDFNFIDKLKVISNVLKTQSFKQIIKWLLTKIRSSSSSIDKEYFNFWKSNGVFIYLKDKSVEAKFYKQLKFDNKLLSIKKFEYKYWLQGLLHVEDRSSMYASLESRVPLLDYRLSEYVFKLNPSYMIDGILNKKLLIDSFKTKLISDVSDNKNKKGYASPIDAWFQNVEVKNFINQIIENKKSYIYKFVQFDSRNKFNHRQIWMLISLELWYKIFIIKEIKIYK